MGHARPLLVSLTVLAAIGAVLAVLRLEPTVDTDTFVDGDSDAAVATERYRDRFGDDAVLVLARADLQQLMFSSDLGRVLALEGCLSGRVPAGAQPAPGPCEEIAALDPVRVVYGPGTFVNEAANRVAEQLGSQREQTIERAKRADSAAQEAIKREGGSKAEQVQAGQDAAEAVAGDLAKRLIDTGLRFGITQNIRIDDPNFVSRLVFDSTKPAGTPKERLSYLFPSSSAALISVRLKPDLSSSDRERAIELIRQATADPDYTLRSGDFVVSGLPVVIDAVAQTLLTAVLVLLAAVLAAMAIALMVVVRPPLRLLPLGIALIASGLLFGVLGAIGASLTLATIGVLPVLVGLSVDYAIQMQSRVREELEGGGEPIPAVVRAASASGPVLLTAMAATLAGFAALVLSPVPMVRGFGLLLAIGVAGAFAIAMTAGMAALAWAAQVPETGGRVDGRGRLLRPRLPRRRRRGNQAAGQAEPRVRRFVRVRQLPRPRIPQRLSGRIRPRRPAIPPSVRSAASRIRRSARRRRAAAGVRLREVGRATLAVTIVQPGRVLVVGALLAAIGWGASVRSDVVSDVRELVPQDIAAISDLQLLQDASGVAGEVDITVRSDGGQSVARPEVITWMSGFSQDILARNGYAGEDASCDAARLCPAIALPDLFRSGEPSQSRIDSLLDAVPRYFSQAVITEDRQTASMAFGVRVGPLDRQQKIVDSIRDQLDKTPPPSGVQAEVAGLPALIAEANQAIGRSRYWLTALGLLAIAAVLFAITRDARRTLVPLVPVVLATGWSALVLASMEVSLNPLSATLGALILAITTEFSVILSARYLAEREAGQSIGQALRTTYQRTGTAVAASALTTLIGFAVLMVSDIRMLRDFGFATVVDLGVALVGVVAVLPAALVWSESAQADRLAGRLSAIRRPRMPRPRSLLPARLARR